MNKDNLNNIDIMSFLNSMQNLQRGPIKKKKSSFTLPFLALGTRRMHHTAPATSLYGATGAVQSPYQGVYVDNPCQSSVNGEHDIQKSPVP